MVLIGYLTGILVGWTAHWYCTKPAAPKPVQLIKNINGFVEVK